MNLRSIASVIITMLKAAASMAQVFAVQGDDKPVASKAPAHQHAGAARGDADVLVGLMSR